MWIIGSPRGGSEASATLSCTDASGNYLGEDPDAVVEAYVGVESTAGRLLCPGCRRAATQPVSADPARLGGLIYFGTSDENLYLVCGEELKNVGAPHEYARVKTAEPLRTRPEPVKPFAQTRNSR